MNSENIRKLVLLLGDLVLYYIAVVTVWAIDFYIRAISEVYWHDYIIGYTTFLPLWLAIFYIFDLYSENIIMNGIEHLKASTSAIITATFISFIWFHKLRFLVYIRSILSFVILAALAFVLFGLWRRYYRSLFANKRILTPTLLLQTHGSADEIKDEIAARPFCGLTITKALNIESESLADLKDQITTLKIKHLIVDDSSLQNNHVVQELFKQLPLQIEVVRLSTFMEQLCHRVFINHIGQIWFLDHVSNTSKRIHDKVTQVAAPFLAFILIILFAPFIILTLLLVLLFSGRPIFYGQQRVGHLGKTFKLYKFRSMKNDAEKNGPQWASTKDIRVTKIGNFLRKSRLDELPQLYNILRGEMNFIGPRPERPEFVSMLSEKIPYYNERHLVAPGLTGWAQVNYRYGMSVEDSLKKLQFDLYYIKNRSLVLDLAILLKTIKVVLYQKGT